MVTGLSTSRQGLRRSNQFSTATNFALWQKLYLIELSVPMTSKIYAFSGYELCFTYVSLLRMTINMDGLSIENVHVGCWYVNLFTGFLSHYLKLSYKYMCGCVSVSSLQLYIRYVCVSLNHDLMKGQWKGKKSWGKGTSIFFFFKFKLKLNFGLQDALKQLWRLAYPDKELPAL